MTDDDADAIDLSPGVVREVTLTLPVAVGVELVAALVGEFITVATAQILKS